MNKVYLVKNQQQMFLAKDGQWLDAKERRKLFFSKHQDEALNTLLEVNSQHIHLRLEIVESKLCEKRLPTLNEDF